MAVTFLGNKDNTGSGASLAAETTTTEENGKKEKMIDFVQTSKIGSTVLFHANLDEVPANTKADVYCMTSGGTWLYKSTYLTNADGSFCFEIDETADMKIVY